MPTQILSRPSLNVILLMSLSCALAPLAHSQSTNASKPNLLKDNGFEKPSLTASVPFHFGKDALIELPNYVYPHDAPKGASTVFGWKYGNTTGLISTASGSNPWYGVSSPTGFTGRQYAFIQSVCSLSRSFTVTSPGTYNITWRDAGRPQQSTDDGDQTYNVQLNDATIGSYATTSGQNFTIETLQETLSAGTYTIAFVGTGTTGDHTAFIDAVKISGPQ